MKHHTNSPDEVDQRVRKSIRFDTVIAIAFLIFAFGVFTGAVAVHLPKPDQTLSNEALIDCPFGEQLSIIRHANETFTVRCVNN